MKVTLVAGARPNFMKIAPIIRAIEHRNATCNSMIQYRLVHTGQHYDDKLSRVFFEELGLPHPDVNLNAGSGSQAEQTAKIMVEFEKDLMKNPVDVIIVVGDVNSTMACTIVAKKMNTKVAHVEGGIRSFDMTMPEEINRIVTDSLADYFFTTSNTANENLKHSGIKEEQIFFVGNTMIDSLYFSLPKLQVPSVWNEMQLQEGNYYLLTLHRPSNVDDVEKLSQLLQAIQESVGEKTVIFPVHPRTRSNFDKIGAQFQSLKGIDPLSYFQFIYLLQYAAGVITDSGGVQEETTVLRIPCVTLRQNTERPETVVQGTNVLIGDDLGNLRQALAKIRSGTWKKGEVPDLWDGRTAERIVKILSGLS